MEIPPRPPLPPQPEPAPQAQPERPAPVEPEATTLPLPVLGDTAVLTPITPPAPAPRPAKRRRRGLGVFLGISIPIVVLIALGVIGWFAGNAWAHSTVVDRVTTETRQALSLPASHPVDVGVTDPVLPQLIGGTLSSLTIHVPDAPLAGAAGDVTVHATGVPIRGDGPAASASARVRLTPAAITTLAGDLGRVVPGSLHIVGDNVAVSLDPSQFLSGISFALTLHPSAAAGQLVLTPVAFDVGGFSMSADTVRARFGSLASGILAPRQVCVASSFPKGLTLSALTLDPDAVVADFAVDPRILADPALQKSGSCVP